jgi:ATP-binding protein involved in chromosome partitioning
MIKNLRNIKHKLIVMSGKGGVGKSTVATNIAQVLIERGYKVGLLDADIHGPTIPKLFGVVGKRMKKGKVGVAPLKLDNGLEMASVSLLLENAETPIIWRGPLKMGLIKQFLEDIEWGNLDYLIIDLPPGTGDEPLTIAQLLPDADGVIFVTTPQEVALHAVRRSIRFAMQLNLPIIGIVENMSGLSCPHCGKEIELFTKGGGKKAAEDMGINYLGSIPLDTEIVKYGEEGIPFTAVNTKSTHAFKDIVDSILKYEKEHAKELSKRRKELLMLEKKIQKEKVINNKNRAGSSETKLETKLKSKSEKSKKITKDMYIGEILRTKPKSAEILKRYGMHCIGCPSASAETLEQAMNAHKIDDKLQKKLMIELNR